MRGRARTCFAVGVAASAAVLLAAGPASASRADCNKHKPRGAVVATIGGKPADNGVAILYEGANGKRYGCAFNSKGGVVRVLPGQEGERNATNTLQRDHFAFERRWVAYASVYAKRGSAPRDRELRVYSFNLKKGTRHPSGPEGQDGGVLTSIKLKDNGSVAWMWTYPRGGPVEFTAVDKMDRLSGYHKQEVARDSEMDADGKFDPSSLELPDGTEISWFDTSGRRRPDSDLDGTSRIPIE